MFVSITIARFKYKCALEYFMPTTTITNDAWKCCRCGYVWPNLREKKPLRCAKCGSVYWDIPKIEKEKEEVGDGIR